MKGIWAIAAAAILLAGTAWAADNDTGDTSALIAECGASNLPAASVDSCLERVRIHEETDSAPGLASLEARLEARVAADHEPVGPAPARSGTVEVRPYGAGPAQDADMGAARSVTGPPQPLQNAEGPTQLDAAAAPNSDKEDGIAPENPAPPPVVAGGEAPPEIGPDDEPPIADPPDSDEAPRVGDDGVPPPDDPG